MKLETLYKRTKTGAIQYWQISVESNVITKESGQLGTEKPLVHAEQCEGKNLGRSNETSPSEQAELQAKSDWKKKRDEGYKSLKDLGISEDTTPGDFEKELDSKLGQFNTDAQGQVKPQLAPNDPWKAGAKKNKYPRQIEPKLDGLRSHLVINSVDDLYYLSRSGKPYNTLQHLVDAVRSNIDPRFVEFPIILDGEVYKHGWTLEEISAAVKKFALGVTEQLEFWVYDLPLMNAPQKERTAEVGMIVDQISSRFIRSNLAFLAKSDEHVTTLHDEWVNEGYEGAMLKDLEGVYQPGQRSRYWEKVKMFDDSEFKVVGHKFGQRGAEDLLFVCISPKAVEGYDPEFDVKMSGTREKKLIMAQRLPELMGKMLTVKHFGYSKYGIPNLPIGKAFRDE